MPRIIANTVESMIRLLKQDNTKASIIVSIIMRNDEVKIIYEDYDENSISHIDDASSIRVSCRQEFSLVDDGMKNRENANALFELAAIWEKRRLVIILVVSSCDFDSLIREGIDLSMLREKQWIKDQPRSRWLTSRDDAIAWLGERNDAPQLDAGIFASEDNTHAVIKDNSGKIRALKGGSGVSKGISRSDLLAVVEYVVDSRLEKMEASEPNKPRPRRLYMLIKGFIDGLMFWRK